MTTPALLATLLLGAAPPGLLVVPLGAEPQLSFTARRLAEAVAREVGAERGGEVLGPEQAERRLGRDPAARLFACGANAHCLSALSAPLGVDQVLGGELAQGGRCYVVNLVLVRVKDERVLGTSSRELPIGSPRMQPALVAAARQLLRGEAEATGELLVITEEPGARVTVDGELAGRTPLALRLKAGRHELRLSQVGYVDLGPRVVEVPASGAVEQRIALQPIARRGEGQGVTQVEVSK